MADRFAIAEEIDADDARLFRIIPLGDEPAPHRIFDRREDAAAWIRTREKRTPAVQAAQDAAFRHASEAH